MDLDRFILKLTKTPMERKFYSRIPDNHVLDEGFSAQVFEPDKGYFQIILSEMFLRDKREYWQGFVPLSVIISDFEYDRRRQTIPFFVDNKLLKAVEPYVEGEHVEYYNTRVAGPIPYSGDRVSLFVGLFRIQVDNLAENLFSFLGTIVSSFDFTVLSTYLDIARPLGRGLQDLLGMKQVQLRLGTRDEFTCKPNDPHQFREGYLVYINCPENNISIDKLWVNDSRLFIGTDKKPIEPFTEYDYCLIRIEQLSARSDYTTLPFHKLWEDAKRIIYQGNHINAQWKLMELAQQLAISPDLTQDHRYHLIQVYKANFEKEVALYQQLHGFTSNHIATVSRRGTEGVLGPRESIENTARLAQEGGFPEKVVDGLLELRDNWEQINNWEQIPELKDRDKDFQLANDILNKQLKALESFSKIEKRDPKALADAITFTALNPI